MKIDFLPQEASLVTLQTVLDRLSSHPGLTAARKRDMRSAVNCYAKLVDQPRRQPSRWTSPPSARSSTRSSRRG
jgi:hypothetical protein